MSRIKISIDLDDLVRQYESGVSENELAKRLGIDRSSVRSRLIERNVSVRNQHQAETIKWSQMTADQRVHQVAAAHVAAKGRKISRSVLERKARTIQEKGILNTNERPLFNILSEAGFHIIPQMAIGTYNIDLALDEDRIAIEIFGGGFHGYGNHARRFFKRSKYLFNRGWSLFIIWIDPIQHPLGIGVLNNIRAFVQSVRNNPSPVGKYGVIWGDGKIVARTGHYFNDDAAIKRLSPST